MKLQIDYAIRYKLIIASIFSIAMAYLEAVVVIYLRELYYPEGFAFPLTLIPESVIQLEIMRELVTIVMLFSIALIIARKRWERFGWFIFLFGIWDIFYYFWLKITLNWPLSIFEWDVLFLIPMPWISPVIAPLLIASSLTIMGIWIIKIVNNNPSFRPVRITWVLGILGSTIILYSFMSDKAAILHQQLPLPYAYWQLIVGIACYWVGLLISIRSMQPKEISHIEK